MNPILNQVVFKPFPPDELSKGGLVVPDAFKAVKNKGTIVKVGNGTKDKRMRLKEGVVAYRVKDWGTEFTHEGEQYFLMDESAIIAVE